jgi:hypothetical protein
MIEGLSFAAFRRVATPAETGRAIEMISIGSVVPAPGRARGVPHVLGRLEVLPLQIPQGAAELAVADLVASWNSAARKAVRSFGCSGRATSAMWSICESERTSDMSGLARRRGACRFGSG